MTSYEPGLSGSGTFLFTALIVCSAVAWPIAKRGRRRAMIAVGPRARARPLG